VLLVGLKLVCAGLSLTKGADGLGEAAGVAGVDKLARESSLVTSELLSIGSGCCGEPLTTGRDVASGTVVFGS
jgi:hypothetical protein